MPYRESVFTSGHYYHIYNRGAGKGRLFFNPGNYHYLLELAGRYYRRYGVRVIAYCLMPSHYHFLLCQETDEPLSKFINALFNAYVQAVNNQQNRSGTMFEGRFRHKWIDREEYLLHLCRYIHLNPVQAKLILRPEDWPYSNYLEFIGRRSCVLGEGSFISEHFLTPESYHRFVQGYQENDQANGLIGDYVWD